MWLICGLGNPGSEYDGTRHNVGFEVADMLAERASASFSEKKFKAKLGRGRLAGTDCLFVKPQTFMNLSGESVGPAAGFYKLGTHEMIILHDDLDLDAGRLKLKQGGGHGGHNGLRSLIEHLPDANFVRVRIGIGRPPPRWDSAAYVLSRFGKEDQAAMERALKSAADAVEGIIKDGLRRAMNVWNTDRRPSGSGEETAD
jgi:PTH1 family peptidyl-tRNA hydrolase